MGHMGYLEQCNSATCCTTPSSRNIAIWSGTAYSSRRTWLISLLTSNIWRPFPYRHLGTRWVGGCRPAAELEAAWSQINNDKGRLSKEDIDRMVSEAEKFKEADDRQRERVESRNKLESYVFSVGQALNDAGDKLVSDDKETASRVCEDTLTWLDSNSLAEKEEYDHKLQELQKLCSPLMAKLHSTERNSASSASRKLTTVAAPQL